MMTTLHSVIYNTGVHAFPAYVFAERVDNVDLLIRRAERCLEAGAYMVMIDADDVCQRADSLRADIIAKIVGRLGLEKTMFEASNANTSEWFVRRYGPRVNLFVDHSEVMNLERLRGFNMRRSNPSLLASPFFLNIQHRRRAKETWCKSKMGSTGGGSPDKESAPVCVTGATGYVGSWLICTLLRRGYRVHATARDPGKAWQVLSAVDGKERLRMFRADMGEEGSFDEAVRGCVALFHVAASMELHVSPDQHNVEEHVRSYVLEPAMRGTINVLQSCIRAGTIRRVVFTSSISTMTATGADGQQKAVVDESCLRALDDVWGTKPIGWIYILSKRLTEAAAFRFAQEEGIHLVSVVIPTTAGPFLTPSVPTSIQLMLSPITGDPKLYSLLVSVHARFGSIPFAHIQDVCDAHVFLMETAQAEGRYLCARGSYPMAQIAQLLSSHYPPFKPAESQATQLKLSKDFDASNSSVVSSKRLTDLGFKFEHDVRDIVKDSVAQCVDHGFLDDPDNRSN